MYNCICFSQSIKFVGRPNCNSSSTIKHITSYFQKRSKCDVTFNVTDLKFPFTDYYFHIYVRTSAARGEDKWSAPGSIAVKTKPTSKIINFMLMIRSDVGTNMFYYILWCSSLDNIMTTNLVWIPRFISYIFTRYLPYYTYSNYFPG